MFIVGIDAGGTKTKFSLFDISGNEIDTVSLSTCHFMQVSLHEMEEILKKGIFTLINRNNITEFFVSAGMAGYGNDVNIRNKIEEVFNNILPLKNYKLFNDAQIAVSGAIGDNDGIVIIAGTGSIALSKINNEFKRVSGWGYLLGDEASAYWIGRQTLSIFCKQADGRYEKGALYDICVKHFNLDNDYSLISISKEKFNDRGNVAKISKLAYEAALKNDKYVLNLFEEVANEMALCINSLNDKSLNLYVSYIGGVFNSKDILLPLLKEKLDKNLKLIDPIYSSEKGAYLLALDYIEKN